MGPPGQGVLVKVAYLTSYYNGASDGRFGRFHDWVHTLRELDDPPFDFEVVALTASNPDRTLSSIPYGLFGEATDLWGSKWNKAEFALNAPRAVRDLRRSDFDVLHVLTLDLVAYPIALVLADRSPVVGPDVQGYFPGRLGDRWNHGGLAGAKHRGRFALKRRLLGLADDPTVVALSEYHRRNVAKLGVDPDRVEVIPPGVAPYFTPADRDSDDSRHDRPTEFLYLGDLSSYKGYDLFLEALALLPEDVDATATVVGSGDPDRDRIDALGLSEAVTVEGFVARRDLPEYYRQADFYVMPSIDENGPNTIVEALACGTPVLATDRRGINEYAPADAAIYFERTADAVAAAMRQGHENRSAYASAAAEHARAGEFSAERTVDGLYEVYRHHRDRRR
ncbi:MAG: glycosyltransferase family 4 protein [Haloarculaceae archaeon]